MGQEHPSLSTPVTSSWELCPLWVLSNPVWLCISATDAGTEKVTEMSTFGHMAPREPESPLVIAG